METRVVDMKNKKPPAGQASRLSEKEGGHEKGGIAFQD
jgi:hypothetical protein